MLFIYFLLLFVVTSNSDLFRPHILQCRIEYCTILNPTVLDHCVMTFDYILIPQYNVGLVCNQLVLQLYIFMLIKFVFQKRSDSLFSCVGWASANSISANGLLALIWWPKTILVHCEVIKHAYWLIFQWLSQLIPNWIKQHQLDMKYSMEYVFQNQNDIRI